MFSITNNQKWKSKPQWDYLLTPVTMASNKKTRNNKCWQDCAEKGTLLSCWWEWKLLQPLWNTIWGRKIRLDNFTFSPSLKPFNDGRWTPVQPHNFTAPLSLHTSHHCIIYAHFSQSTFMWAVLSLWNFILSFSTSFN